MINPPTSSKPNAEHGDDPEPYDPGVIVRDTYDSLMMWASRRSGGPLRRARRERSEEYRRFSQTVSAANRRVKAHPTGKDGRAVPRSLDVTPVGSILRQEIRNRGWQQPLAQATVVNKWEHFIGEKVAQHTKVVMFKDATLFILCDSTAWATQLRYLQRTILQKIAQEVGPDVITELRIYGPKAPSWRHGPLHVKGRGPRDTYG